MIEHKEKLFTFLLALMLACQLISCKRDGITADSSPPLPSPSGNNLSPVRKVTAEDQWRQTLLSRLNSEPGTVYCSVGDRTLEIRNIDGKAHSIRGTWPADTIESHLALKPDGTELWCVPPYWEFGKGILKSPVTVMDPKNGTIKDRINCPGAAMTAFTPDSKKAYLSKISSSTVDIYDGKTHEKKGTIEVGRHPKSLSMAFDGRRLYVGHSAAVTASKVTTSQGIKLPKVEVGDRYIAVVDTTTDNVAEKIPVKGIPVGLALKPDGSLLYVSVNNVVHKPYTALTKGPITVIDTTRSIVIKTIIYPGTHPISDLAFTPDGKKVYGICGGLEDSAFVFTTEKHVLKKTIALDIGG